MKWIFNLKKYPVTITYCKAVGFARLLSAPNERRIHEQNEEKTGPPASQAKLQFTLQFTSRWKWVVLATASKKTSVQIALIPCHVLQVCFDIVGVGLHPGLCVLFANKKAAGYVCFPSLGHDNGSEKIIKRRNKTTENETKERWNSFIPSYKVPKAFCT